MNIIVPLFPCYSRNFLDNITNYLNNFLLQYVSNYESQSFSMKNILLTIIIRILVINLCIYNFLSCSSDDNNVSVEEQVSLNEATVVLELVNEVRLEAGLDPLILNSTLNDAAYLHSLDMEKNDYFNHVGLDGSTFSERAIKAGYEGTPTGENIAVGQRTSQAVFNSWINSNGHKANILNANATEMGLGLSGSYWTQVFGKKKLN